MTKTTKTQAKTAKLVTAPKPQLPAVPDKPNAIPMLNNNQLQIIADGRPPAELIAESMMSPITLNALTTLNATRRQMATGDQASAGLNAFATVMATKVKAIAGGDLTGVKQTLAAQMITLDALFSQLSHQAQVNMGQHLGAVDTYLRLAFRAQSQCRTTAEALNDIENPRPMFPKNVNMVAGNQQVNSTTGPQQVNNDAAAPKAIAHEKN
jgi:hypothetical protein